MIDEKEIPVRDESLNEEIAEILEAPEATPEKEPSEVETTPEKEPRVSQQESPKVDSVAENNIKALRQKAARLERENLEYQNRFRQQEQMRYAQPQYQPQAPQPQEEEDLSLNIGTDDLAEGKHISKLDKKLTRQDQKYAKQQEETAKTLQQMQNLLIEANLKEEFPDIKQVITKENMETLRELHPDIGEVIDAAPNYYNKTKVAYKMLKSLNIARDDSFDKEKERIQANVSKPKSLSSLASTKSDSPLTNVNAWQGEMTKAETARLWKEMCDSTKNR